MRKINDFRLRTGLVRLLWPNVFETKIDFETKEDTGLYGVTALIPKEDKDTLRGLQEIFEAAFKKAVEDGKWKDTDSNRARILPKIKDGDDQAEQYPWMEGCFRIEVKTKFQPSLYDTKGNKLVMESELFHGCYGYLIVNAYSYNNKLQGINFGLEAIAVKDASEEHRLYAESRTTASDFGDVMESEDDDFE